MSTDDARPDAAGEWDHFLATAPPVHRQINDILNGALSGSEPRYRTESGHVRWRRVEVDIHNAATAAMAPLHVEACLFYHADGTFEVLDSAEAVVERRKHAAVELEALRARVAELEREHSRVLVLFHGLEPLVAMPWSGTRQPVDILDEYANQHGLVRQYLRYAVVPAALAPAPGDDTPAEATP